MFRGGVYTMKERAKGESDVDNAGAALPAGVTVGHWTDARGRTGCTVVLAPGGRSGTTPSRRASSGTTIVTSGSRP